MEMYKMNKQKANLKDIIIAIIIIVFVYIFFETYKQPSDTTLSIGIASKLIKDQRQNVQVDKWNGYYQCFWSSIVNALDKNGYIENKQIPDTLKWNIENIGAEYPMLIINSPKGSQLWEQFRKLGADLPKKQPKQLFTFWEYNCWLVRYLLNNNKIEGIEKLSKYVRWFDRMSIKGFDNWLKKGYAVVVGTTWGAGHILTVTKRVETGYEVIDTIAPDKKVEVWKDITQKWVGYNEGGVRCMVIIADFKEEIK
jgi:hypothetical protein